MFGKPTPGKIKTAVPVQFQTSELRVPQLAKADFQPIDLGDGYRASKDGASIVVHIPGAQIDTLEASMAEPLTLQLAAAAFIKVANTKEKNAADALRIACISSQPGHTGSGDQVTFHYFKLASGRVARIFVYLNDFDGITAVMEIPSGAVRLPIKINMTGLTH
jgi:hypothetical protein